MISITDLYKSELKRIRKNGAIVRHRSTPNYYVGSFFAPNRIIIKPNICPLSLKLYVLLHEEGHFVDKKFLNRNCMMQEYYAEKHALTRILALDNINLLKRAIYEIHIIASDKYYIDEVFYGQACRKLQRTNLWKKAIQKLKNRV